MKNGTILLLFLLLLALLTPFLNSCQNTPSIKYDGHGSSSLDPKIVQRFAPPILPPQELEQIQKMLDIRTTSLGQLTPNGKNLFVNWSVTGTSQVWKLNSPKAFPVQMTGGQDATHLQGITADGKYLILSRDKSGDEYPGLYLQKVTGGPLITIYKKNKVQVFYQASTKDGGFIYYRANDVDPESYSFYKYNLGTKKREKIFAGVGYWTMSDRLPSGKILLAKWTGNTSSEYYLLDENSKKLTPLFGQNEKEEYQAQFGRDDKTIIVLTNKFSNFRALYSFRGKKMKRISPSISSDIAYFDIDQSRKRILYGINHQARYKMAGLNIKTFAPLKLPKFRHAVHTYFGKSTRNGNYTALGVVSAKMPRTNYILNWRTNKLTQWSLPSGPEIDTLEFVEQKLESYKTHDGVEIPMFVARPKSCAKKSCPVIVNFHGGPEGQSHPGFNPYIQIFIEQGFIFVQPNVRGSDGYGKEWLHSDNGAKRLQVITDIRDCASWIKKNWSHNGVVPKIGVMGGSYGGYSTLIAMTMFAGSYDAGSALVGMSNLETFLENTAPYRRKLRESEYGYLATDRAILKKLSPVTYLDQIRAPLQIIHGVNDPRVPAGEAVQIQAALQAKNIASHLILFPDEGHGIRKRKNRAISIGHTINFFNKHLK